MEKNRTMELFAALLRSSLGDQLAPGAVSFTDMLADDAVMEFPYAPPGLPKVLNGKAAIRKHVEALGGTIRVEQFSSPVVYQTPTGFVIEFSCSGIATQTGRPYNQEYVSVITLRDGLIVRCRDYWNPLIVLQAIEPEEAVEEEGASNV
jgi:ketosteroid isomerase-like protein